MSIDASAVTGADGGAVQLEGIQIVEAPAPAALVAPKLWDEYYAECLRDSAAALEAMLAAGKTPHSQPASAAAVAEPAAAAATKSDAKSDAKAEGEAIGGAAAGGGQSSVAPAAPEAAAAAAAADAKSAPAATAADGAVVSVAVVAVGDAAAAASAAPAAAPRGSVDSTASSGSAGAGGRATTRNPNHLNWQALQAAADSESKRFDAAHVPIKERLYDAYDGGAGALAVGPLKQLVEEAVEGRRRVMGAEIDLLIRSAGAAAVAVARTTGASAPVLAAYEKHVHAQLAAQVQALAAMAHAILDKALSNAENISIALHAAMDVDRDGKLRKAEFLSEWKRAFDDLVDYQPLMAKLRLAMAQ